MTDVRIVFMGTPDFAVATLKALIDHNFNVVGVITAPDRPSGRGRKLNQSAVKKYASEQQLTILQPTNLKNESFLNELKTLDANLQIVVAFRCPSVRLYDFCNFLTESSRVTGQTALRRHLGIQTRRWTVRLRLRQDYLPVGSGYCWPG